MSNQELPIWVPCNPEEEKDRVERHLEMAREMLNDTDDGESTVCKVSFSRILEENGMITLAPGEHLGILLGIDETYPPKFILGSYAVHLTEVDEDTDDFTFDVQLDRADLTLVPVREVNEFWGATGTVATWQYLQDRDDSASENSQRD